MTTILSLSIMVTFWLHLVKCVSMINVAHIVHEVVEWATIYGLCLIPMSYIYKYCC